MIEPLVEAAKTFGPWVVLAGVLVWQSILREKNMRDDFHELDRRCESSEKFIRDELSEMNDKLIKCVAQNTRAFDRTNELLDRIGAELGESNASFRDRGSPGHR